MLTVELWRQKSLKLKQFYSKLFLLYAKRYKRVPAKQQDGKVNYNIKPRPWKIPIFKNNFD